MIRGAKNFEARSKLTDNIRANLARNGDPRTEREHTNKNALRTQMNILTTLPLKGFAQFGMVAGRDVHLIGQRVAEGVAHQSLFSWR
jgi:hypothetical protein